jgi:predicted nicotinamide N-methyase
MVRRLMTKDLRAFLAANTTLAAPPLCPELPLYTATGSIELWQATETFLERPNLPPPFWAFAWPGGQALARHLLDHPELVRGFHVLDFASGGGLQAIAAARAGAARVTATEIDPLALEMMALNFATSGVEVEVSGADVVDTDGGWDVVLAGDVCYEKTMSERIVAWLRRLSARGALVLMGDPGRTYLPKAGLTAVATHDVPTTLDLEDRTSRRTVVWRVDAA